MAWISTDTAPPSPLPTRQALRTLQQAKAMRCRGWVEVARGWGRRW